MFNNRLQVTELNLGHSVVNNPGDAGGHLWKLGYEYGELDENGEVLPATNTGNIGKQTLSVPGVTFVQRYKYDSLYRLTSAKETAEETETWSHTFSYDRFGNRTFFEELINGIRSTRTAPAINANTNRFSSSEFTYDKNGNITRDIDAVTSQERTFIFNGDNKQAEIRDANGILIGKYFYDGEGKRVKKFIFATNETTVFVYSSGKLVAEYTTALPTANPSINYTATDMLGSPRVITNQLGNVVSRRDFMPFGEEIPVEAGDRASVVDVNAIAEVDNSGNLRTTALNYQSTDGIRQRFTGYQKDTETSLDFAEARMYESRYGRFTAVDPLLASGKSSNPQTFNRFVYTSNNPIVRIDINGKDWWDVIDNHSKQREIRWFDDDPDEDAYQVNQRWTNYVYQADDKRYYALNPTANESDVFYDYDTAKMQYGKYVDFDGAYDGLIYEALAVKDLAYLTANINTGDIDGSLYYFGKIGILEGTPIGVGKYLAGPGAAVAGSSAEKAVTSMVPKAASSLGAWGEARLAQVLGGAVEKNTARLSTSLGNRVPDFLVDGVAHEAKAGLNVGLKNNSTIQKQILKDVELIQSGRIKSAHWHFFQGAQQDVLDFLTQNGIKYTLH